MPFEPLRFLHAANLRLDHSIGGSVRLPAKIVPIVQNATLAAFDRLVAAAIDRGVDFVLLAGNTFVEHERSLAARLALVDGFERLAAESIRVFVLPGPLDPLDAWRRIPDLPKNVTVLDANHKAHVAFKRDDAVVARIGTGLRAPDRKGRSSRRELRSEVQRPVPFAIGALVTNGDAADPRTLRAWSEEQGGEAGPPDQNSPLSEHAIDQVVDSPVDYLALGGGRTRRTITKRRGIAHDPGAVQGNGSRETGPRGCTLVGVESDGTVRCDFVPTASVRWERFVVACDDAMHGGDLVRRCRAHLDEMRWESSENAWILEWVFEGPPAAIALLEDEIFRRQFQHELNEGLVSPNAEATVHHFVFNSDSHAAESRFDGDPLDADFRDALAAIGRDPHAAVAGSLAETRAADAEWAGRLEAVLSELPPESIRMHAARVLRRIARAEAEGSAR